MDGMATVIPKRENLKIVSVKQLDKDAIVICHDNVVRIVTQQGKLRDTKKQVSDFQFNFKIDSIGNEKKIFSKECMNETNVYLFFSYSLFT